MGVMPEWKVIAAPTRRTLEFHAQQLPNMLSSAHVGERWETTVIPNTLSSHPSGIPTATTFHGRPRSGAGPTETRIDLASEP